MDSKIDPILTDIPEALDILQPEQILGLDIETSGLSFMKDEIAVVSLYGEKTKRSAILHVQGYLPPSLLDFLSEKRLLITHNGASFDLLFLARAGVNLEGPVWFDTLLAESLTLASARKDLRVSLQAAVKRRLGILLAKDQGLSTWMAKSLTSEQLRYCVEDVKYLPRLRKAQLKAMTPEQKKALTWEMDLLPAVVAMTLRGLPIDNDLLTLQEDHLRKQHIWANEYLQTTLGPMNYASPTQITAKIQEHTGFTLKSSSLESLKALSEEPGRVGTIGKALVLVKQEVKTNGQPLWDNDYLFDGRLYPRYRQIDRENGRLSSSEPDMEKAPVSARSVIGGQPGWTMLSVSWKNLWWGVVASLAKDPVMQALVKESLASAVAEKLFGPPADNEKGVTDARIAVALIRSCLFGHPLDKFEYQLRILTVPQSSSALHALHHHFLNAFPRLSQWQAQAVSQSRLPAVPVVFPSGMRRTLANPRPHEILSLKAKSMVGYLVKEGLSALAKKKLDNHLCGVIGEEYLFSLPLSVQEQMQQSIQEELLTTTKKVLGFPLELTLVAGSHVTV